MEKSVTIGLGLAIAVAGAFTADMVAPPAANASPVPYVTGPNDVPNVMVNNAISNVNSAIGAAGTTCFGSGNASGNITCNSTRVAASLTNLTTGNAAASGTLTVNDSSVTAASQVTCAVVGYGGAGNPTPILVVPAAGNFTVGVWNLGGGALNATVPVLCTVQN